MPVELVYTLINFLSGIFSDLLGPDPDTSIFIIKKLNVRMD
jgi:hypothetical protein